MTHSSSTLVIVVRLHWHSCLNIKGSDLFHILVNSVWEFKLIVENILKFKKDIIKSFIFQHATLFSNTQIKAQAPIQQECSISIPVLEFLSKVLFFIFSLYFAFFSFVFNNYKRKLTWSRNPSWMFYYHKDFFQISSQLWNNIIWKLRCIISEVQWEIPKIKHDVVPPE